MREYKFRAYLKEKSLLVKVSQIFFDSKYVAVWDTQEQCMLLPDFHQVELMQYTGFNDKNGKEIYEGDIVCAEYNTVDKCGNLFCAYMNCEIIFEDGSFELYPTEGRIIDITEKMEVIGNIHENPELLEAGNERGQA